LGKKEADTSRGNREENKGVYQENLWKKTGGRRKKGTYEQTLGRAPPKELLGTLKEWNKEGKGSFGGKGGPFRQSEQAIERGKQKPLLKGGG